LLSLPPKVRVFVATAPCDLRKQFDGIAVLVEQGLHHDPRSGHLFVVFNRRGDQVRILFWDRQATACLRNDSSAADFGCRGIRPRRVRRWRWKQPSWR
jgi:transposase